LIAIYVRVSTEEQATKGYSVQGQIEACIKKAGTSDVLQYVDEGWTGEIIERPGLIRLREDIKKGIVDELICYDPDRLSRKLMNQLILDDEFKRQGVKILFVNGEYAETSEGHLFFSMRGAFSEFEKAKIKERTSGGRRTKAKNGKVVKNNHLYGYNFDKEKSMYVVNEEEAKVVKMIFDYYTDPKFGFQGMNGIAKHLTDLDIPRKRNGKVWHRNVIRQILTNQSYTGTYIQNRWNTEGGYVAKQRGDKFVQGVRDEEEWIVINIPPIIDEVQFKRAQDLMQHGRRRSSGHYSHDYLLSGLVRCGQCGRSMTGKRTLSHGKDFYIYTCKKNNPGYTGTCSRQMSENKLNKAVWDNVYEIIKNPDLVDVMEKGNGNDHLVKELDMINAELEKNKKGRQRLVKLVSLSEDIDTTDIIEELRQMQERFNKLNEKKTEIESELSTEPSIDKSNVEAISNKYNNIVETQLTREDKKELIRSLVKEVIVVDKDTVRINLF
jgi:site-specific DNA recombinase